MNKATLILLASSGLLGALLLIANPANAAEIFSPIADSAISAQATQVRLGNPMLTFNLQQGNPILDQLGCSCATCTTARRLQGQLPQ
ncbi:hypothetical protein [Argonema galeatum]|uniref:hypothetical protein n=1 Tax=Argonema galeatum TaxID=2942762 RepID=UPI0020113AE7|nr:hypothetical protein [Argonema galeatum]MCL1466982.1 hypothetical protein [Argonema galeatum A003/A1]